MTLLFFERWLDEFSKIALSKPYIENICWANLSDISSNLPGGGLLTDMLQPKPVLGVSQTMREALGRPRKA